MNPLARDTTMAMDAKNARLDTAKGLSVAGCL